MKKSRLEPNGPVRARRRAAAMAAPPPPPRSGISELHGEKTAEQLLPWQEHEELRAELRQFRGQAGRLEATAGRLRERAEAVSAGAATSSGSCGARPIVL